MADQVFIHIYSNQIILHNNSLSIVTEMPGFCIALSMSWVQGGENRVLYQSVSFLFVSDFNIHDRLASLLLQF